MLFQRQCSQSLQRFIPRSRYIYVSLVLFVLAGEPADARIIRVSSTGDGSNGTSWDTAFNRVADALDAAEYGDAIWVNAGSCNESIELVDGVSLYGGFIGTETDTEFYLRDWRSNETILDATGLNKRVIDGASETVVDGFTITNGLTTQQGGGGGLHCRSVNMRIANCNIVSNTALDSGVPSGDPSNQGGGFSCFLANVSIVNCVIQFNRADYGGGVYAHRSNVLLRNCLVDDNMFTAVRPNNAEIVFQNCTFGLKNVGIADTGDDYFGGGVGRFRNCIMRKPFYDILFPTEAVYSNLVATDGEGNIDQDPQWVDPENGDYRLKLSSPCIDSGTTTGPATDLDGNPRPVDVLGIGRDGPGAYDMGCYEFQLNKADLNSDGQVNACDLFLFEDQWHSE